ncbi:enolase-phosphatase E1 [Galendromus occidentalis]|uniref:Enolase-phosphatase E1 n=1 Tax=Galendromus occidentalis TaxID=34638 RepID=A0AAJ6QKX6_9ACAR|nr:enolase-phosphatase E1 [Galendromus occidentalis]
MEFSGIKYILLDIEGTVTPISFVKDVLFVYAREKLVKFLDENWDNNEDLADAVELIIKYSLGEPESPPTDGSKPTLVESVLWQMDRDVKDAGLKKLQSLIWKDGYYTGQLKSDLYEDVYDALPAWQARNMPIGIYSSGSVAAQKDLFNYTKRGSMLRFLSSFHDLTTAGSKLEAASYSKISDSVGLQPSEILFLTDVFGEYTAALAAGMKSVIVLRPGNKPLTETELNQCITISKFDEIKFL